MEIPEKIIKASALTDPYAASEEDPPLTDAFPVNPTPDHNFIEKKRRNKYLHYIRRWLSLKEKGDSDEAERTLQKALTALEGLCNWYRSPFISCDSDYVDEVDALYDRVEEELGVRFSSKSKRGLPLSSFENVPKDDERVKEISLFFKVFNIDAYSPKDLRGYIPSGGFEWLDVPLSGKSASREQKEKYDSVVGNNVVGYGDMIYRAKGNSRRCHLDLIAALNRSAEHDLKSEQTGFGDFDLSEGLSFCIYPEDRPVADMIRVNRANVRYRYGLYNFEKNHIPDAHSIFFEAIAMLRTCSQDLLAKIAFRGALEARLLKGLGDTALLQGDTRGAYCCYSEAIDTSGADRVIRSCAYSGLAALAALTDDAEGAEDYLNIALQECEDDGLNKRQSDLRKAAVQYQLGYLKKDKKALQKAYEDFTLLGCPDCAALIAELFDELFRCEPKPIPEPEPEPIKPKIYKKPDDVFITQGRVLSGDGLQLYLELSRFADGDPYTGYDRSELQYRVDRARRQYERCNIEYDAEEDDDFFFSGDPASADEYGDAVEALMNDRVKRGEIPSAIAEAERLLQLREDTVRMCGKSVDKRYWDSRTVAICKLAWLKKSRADYDRALDLEWAHPEKRTVIFLMMVRCGLVGDGDECAVLGHDWEGGRCLRCGLTVMAEYNRLCCLDPMDDCFISDKERFDRLYDKLILKTEEIACEEKYKKEAESFAKMNSYISSATSALDRCGRRQEAVWLCRERMDVYIEEADTDAGLYKLAILFVLFGCLLRREEPVSSGLGIIGSVLNRQSYPARKDLELRAIAVELRDCLKATPHNSGVRIARSDFSSVCTNNQFAY